MSIVNKIDSLVAALRQKLNSKLVYPEIGYLHLRCNLGIDGQKPRYGLYQVINKDGGCTSLGIRYVIAGDMADYLNNLLNDTNKLKKFKKELRVPVN